MDAKEFENFQDFSENLIYQITTDPCELLDPSIETDIELVLEKLKETGEAFLFLFDNIDELVEMKVGRELFLELIQKILRSSTKNKVLLTKRTPLVDHRVKENFETI
jgi:hypothetical protein